MENKHTPGEWRTSYTRDGKAILINKGRVAEVYSDDIDEDEAEANARLIAAAPDLLGALEAVKFILRITPEINKQKAFINLISDIDTAIAKARG